MCSSSSVVNEAALSAFGCESTTSPPRSSVHTGGDPAYSRRPDGRSLLSTSNARRPKRASRDDRDHDPLVSSYSARHERRTQDDAFRNPVDRRRLRRSRRDPFFVATTVLCGVLVAWVFTISVLNRQPPRFDPVGHFLDGVY